MPIHDWTRVDAETFHHFHQTWIPDIARALNGGLLPGDYYAMAEQTAGRWGPDVLTLGRPSFGRSIAQSTPGGVALKNAPPRTRYRGRAAETEAYAAKADSVVIRHRSGHEVVAFIEVISPGNKASTATPAKFVQKARELIDNGIHLLTVDLFPPTPRDPHGIHRAIWGEGREGDFPLPPDKPLTCVSYMADVLTEVFLEPLSVGDALPEMPLYLWPSAYVSVPLEKTYMGAWDAVPSLWRDVITGAAVG